VQVSVAVVEGLYMATQAKLRVGDKVALPYGRYAWYSAKSHRIIILTSEIGVVTHVNVPSPMFPGIVYDVAQFGDKRSGIKLTSTADGPMLKVRRVRR
jgi:hypothetical protein